MDASDAAALDPAASGDRLWIAYGAPDGAREQLFVSAWSTGAVRGRRIATREFAPGAGRTAREGRGASSAATAGRWNCGSLSVCRRRIRRVPIVGAA